MIIRILLVATIFIIIARFIVRFVMPLLQVSSIASDRLKQMQQQMDEMQRKANNQQNNNNGNSRPKVKQGDYIDYEEVK